MIEANNGRYKWISGVFKEMRNREEYFEQIPEHLKSFQQTKAIHITEYPFYIIEKGEEYTYLDKIGFLQMLNNLDLTYVDENMVHFNFYFIESDYCPEKPGTDYMGSLKHEHVTDFFMSLYRNEGEDLLRRNGWL